MIVPIVEGDGEVSAVPLLLRRLTAELGIYDAPVGKAEIRHRSQLVQELGFKQAVKMAAYTPGASAVFVIFDSDDSCARDIVPTLRQLAAMEVGHFPVAVVLARREYEAWFLASLESLRGVQGIKLDALYSSDPEVKREAKGQLKTYFPLKGAYLPTFHQAALTAKFYLAQAYRRCSSFRKLVKELCRILEATGHTSVIPQEWQASPEQPSGIG